MNKLLSHSTVSLVDWVVDVAACLPALKFLLHIFALKLPIGNELH